MTGVQTCALPISIAEMNARGTPFIGLLYAGLALTSEGLKVIEFNARFGDPEAQVLLPRLKTPLATLLYQAATGALHEAPALEWSAESAVSVVLAAEGYPSTPQIGDPITGMDSVEGAFVYQAGTTIKDGVLQSAGGRVLSVTAMGQNLSVARSKAYEGISKITLRGSHYRSDIALKALTQNKTTEVEDN